MDPGLIIPATVIVLLLIGLAGLWARSRKLARAQYIRRYRFPPGLFERLAKKRPALLRKEYELVARGLRQFFLAYLLGGRKFVAMPSQVADELWHEFILYTREYERFCRKAFGQFLHHTPAVVLSPDRRGNAGLRRCWWYCCLEENINPRQATRLPLLFALDTKLAVADGFRYAPDCDKLRRGGDGSVHCGGDFGSASFDGGTDGFGDGGAGDGDGGCGGGCGGD
jgi:hypothetical protein